MRILVVGAGGIGGYFGGRLAAANRDVTFLVRPSRAEILKSRGLIIRSPLGNVAIPQPNLLVASELSQHFDLIVVSCKAYDLEDAINSFAPAVGPETAILPLLNGMAHLDILQGRFGTEAVLGGSCFVSTTVGKDGEIVHLNDTHKLTFGEPASGLTPRVREIAASLSNCGFDVVVSENILQDIWNKWTFIAASAGMTCLMRSSIGDYVEAGATDIAIRLLDECARTAENEGYSLDATILEDIRSYITAAGSTITTSMLRDLERGLRIEDRHIIGEMLLRAQKYGPAPLLDLINANLSAYHIRRIRESSRER